MQKQIPVSIRLKPRELEALKTIAAAYDETISTLIRDAVRALIKRHAKILSHTESRTKQQSTDIDTSDT